jgi:hypothetical protein
LNPQPDEAEEDKQEHEEEEGDDTGNDDPDEIGVEAAFAVFISCLTYLCEE